MVHFDDNGNLHSNENLFTTAIFQFAVSQLLYIVEAFSWNSQNYVLIILPFYYLKVAYNINEEIRTLF